MEQKKAFQKVAFGVIGFAVVVLIGFILYQQYVLRTLSNNENSQVSTVAASDATSKPSIAKSAVKSTAKAGQEEVDGLNYQIKAAEEELSMTRE